LILPVIGRCGSAGHSGKAEAAALHRLSVRMTASDVWADPEEDGLPVRPHPLAPDQGHRAKAASQAGKAGI